MFNQVSNFQKVGDLLFVIPALETARCILKPVAIDDKDDLAMLYTDKKVWEYLGGPRNQVRVKTGIDNMIDPDQYSAFWTVRLKDTQEFLGIISITPHHDKANTEISYLFLSSFWKMGYALESVGDLLRYVFMVSGLEKIVAETQSENASSCKLLRKLEFHEQQRIIRFGAEQIIWEIKSNNEYSAKR